MLGGLALLQEILENLFQAGTTERIVPSSVMHLVECIDGQAPADISIILSGGFAILKSQAKSSTSPLQPVLF